MSLNFTLRKQHCVWSVDYYENRRLDYNWQLLIWLIKAAQLLGFLLHCSTHCTWALGCEEFRDRTECGSSLFHEAPITKIENQEQVLDQTVGLESCFTLVQKSYCIFWLLQNFSTGDTLWLRHCFVRSSARLHTPLGAFPKQRYISHTLHVSRRKPNVSPPWKAAGGNRMSEALSDWWI